METAKTYQTTIEVILWHWSTNKARKHPVKLRLTHARDRRYYPVIHNNKKLFLSQAEWKATQDRTKKLRGDKKAIRDSIDRATNEANNAYTNITTNNKPFTWLGFEAEYLSQESTKGFLKLFKDHLEELRREERIGTFKAYNSAFQAFNEFRGGIRKKNGSRDGEKEKSGKDLNPIDITPPLLKQFETFMKRKGVTRNTIAIYMRTLKVIFNIGVTKNPSLAEFYPFAKKPNDKVNYKIKTGAGRKGEALSIEQIQDFMDIETTPDTPEHLAKNLWLFSFHCQGMNMKDIAMLKYSDIKGESISYVRQKTKDTELIETPIEIPLTDSIRDIIIEMANPDKGSSAYVFDILKPRMNPEKRDAVIRQKIKQVNKYLKRMCESNDLPEITTYWARHSYANLLKESGESIDMIRELLGHSDVKTTESYLKRFDIGLKRAINTKLQALFNKKSA